MISPENHNNTDLGNTVHGRVLISKLELYYNFAVKHTEFQIKLWHGEYGLHMRFSGFPNQDPVACYSNAFFLVSHCLPSPVLLDVHFQQRVATP